MIIAKTKTIFPLQKWVSQNINRNRAKGIGLREKISEDMTDSEFNMWRAVFAFSLLDNVLSPQGQKLLQPYSKTTEFSQDQNDILMNDYKEPQSVETLYGRITDPKDKERFCALARALAWCGGNLSDLEAILKNLSCLAKGAYHDVPACARGHPHLKGHYIKYGQDGMISICKLPSIH